MNRYYKFILAFLIVLFVGSFTLYGQESKYNVSLIKKIYSLGTASVDGTYYPLGNAIAKLFGKKIKKLVIIPEPTAGSVANIEFMQKKRIDLALVQSDVAWKVYHNNFKNLRVLSSLYSEKMQIIVRADSNIKNIVDLKGKKIAVGEKDSGSAVCANQILELCGLKQENDYELVHEKFTKSIESMIDGYIDAICYVGAVTTNGISRLANTIPIKMLEIPTPIIDQLVTSFQYYSKESIEAGSYKGQDEKVNTLGFRALLVCTEQLPVDEAFNMLSVIYNYPIKLSKENREVVFELKRENALKGVDPTMLHEGAARFFVTKNK